MADTTQTAPNPVIQSYLNDNGVDYGKRSGVMKALQSGQSQDSIVQLISQKYGEKYTTGVADHARVPQIAQPSTTSGASDSMDSKPTNTPDAPPSNSMNIGDIANGVMKFGNDATKGMVDMVNPLAMANKVVKGVTGTVNALNQGANQIKEGGSQFVTGMSDAGKSLLEGKGNDQASTDINQGFTKAIGGVLGTATAPVAGITETLPDAAKDTVKSVMDAPNVAIGNIAHSIVNHLRPDLPADYIEKNIVAPLQQAANVGMIVAGPELAKNPMVKDFINKTLSKAPAEIQKGINATSNAIDTATDLTNTLKKTAGDAVKTGSEAVSNVASHIKDDLIKPDFQKEALRSAMKEEHIGTVQNLTPDQANHFHTLLDAGKNKLIDSSAPSTFQVAGKAIEDVYKNLQNKKIEVGKALGAEKEAMAETSVQTPIIKASFQDALSKLNAISQKGGRAILDLEKSDLGGLNLNKQVEGFYKKLSQNKELPAKDIESMTKQIENKVGVGDGQVAAKTPAGKALLSLKAALNNSLGEINPKFGELNKQFAKLAQGLDDSLQAGKVKVGKNGSTLSGATALQRLLSSVPEKTQAGLAALTKLAKEHNIAMPEDLQTTANLADMAEKYSGTVQPRSMKGIVEQGAHHVPGAVGTVVDIAKKIGDYVNPKMKLAEQIDKIKGLVNRAQALQTKK